MVGVVRELATRVHSSNNRAGSGSTLVDMHQLLAVKAPICLPLTGLKETCEGEGMINGIGILGVSSNLVM